MEMQNQKVAGAKAAHATQKYLDIAEIKDNTVLMKDGSLRAVIAVSSTNFALKSEDEQNAITAAYQNFLNSLNFPLQILMHSRVLDINGYLEKLRTLAASQTNELLRIQMNEYLEYIARLVEYSSIMTKTFYVVVPYSATPIKEHFGSKLLKIFNPAVQIAAREEDFEKARTRLEERISHVISELGGMGLRSILLNTEELVELLYNSYNFESASPLYAEAVEGLEINQSDSNLRMTSE